MNAIDDDKANLARHCWINVVLIRNDGLDCTFQCNSWLEFCERVVATADDSFWGAAHGGIARVFGREDGRGLEEHTVADCRRIVEANAAPRA